MAAAPSLSTTTTSVAPAGGTYASIEHAGECMLKQHCGSFPNTVNSYILPPLFHVEFPEAHGQTTSEMVENSSRLLTTKEVAKLVGIRGNQLAEQAEHDVFCMFKKLICEQQKEPLLMLRCFCLDNDNGKDIKRNALQNELHINLRSINTHDERDVVILVQNLGAVFIEIKTSGSTKNITKAEQQLQNGEDFITLLMDGVTSAPIQFPCVRMVVVPNEPTPSPSSTTTHGTHIIHHDLCKTFVTKWQEVLNELHILKATNPFTVDEFTRLTRLMVGIWSMKPMKPTNYIFDDTEASSPAQIKAIDTMVEEGHLSSDVTKVKKEKVKELPVTDARHCKQADIFRQTKDITLMYLTPSQKNIFDNVPRAIIRGPAGTGKSLLILFKIIEIKRTQPNAKILLVAPHPHDIRCRNILASNNVDVAIIKGFPPKQTIVKTFKIFHGFQPKVIIMTLADFFHVSCETLLSYDLSGHNLFFDDLQGCRLDLSKEDKISYDDIFNFIEQSYATAYQTNLHMWCAFDAVQSISFTYTDNDNPRRLLYTNDGTGKEKKMSTPLYSLEDVLRNSKEIFQCVVEARDRAVVGNVSQTIANVHVGHNITSAPIILHRLCAGSDDKYKGQFVVEMIKNELEVLFGSLHCLSPSDITIMHGGYGDAGDYKPALIQMLHNKFNINIQTIVEQLESTNDHDLVYVDGWTNINSYETQCLIYVDDYDFSSTYEHVMYSIISRARTLLIIIQPDVDQNNFTPNHCNILTWRLLNGNFIKQ